MFSVLRTPAAQDLRAVDKLVLIYFKWRQGDNGFSWPSLRTIETDLHIDRGNLLRSLRRLEAAGCIHRQPGKSGRGHPNHYEVLAGKGMPDNTLSPEIKGCPVAPFPAEKGMSDDTGKGCPVAPEGIGKEQEKSIARRSTCSHRQSPKAKTTPFTPPTVEEVQVYATERGRPDFDAEHFVEHYTTAGWCDIGGNPVRNWKGKVLAWLKRDERGQGNRLDADGNPRIPGATYSRTGKLVSRPPTSEQEQELIAMGIIAP